MATATGRDILATSPRDTLTGVAARNVPVPRPHSIPIPLPTPPNSISPALPPHGLKAQLQQAAAKLEPIDSDLDLLDAGGSGGSGGFSGLAAAIADAGGVGSPAFESSDAITPTMLAKYHLPDILLNHGPLAIRYITGHLTATVPGFSFIPPAKSRRLVVAALEGRGNAADGEGGIGGLNGDVEFQKVSWGVWGARRLPSGSEDGGSQHLSSPPLHRSLGIPIAIAAGGGGNGNVGVGGGSGEGVSVERLRQHNKQSGALYRAGNLRNADVMEDEADKMSMDDALDDNNGDYSGDSDGPVSASCDEALDEDISMDDDSANLTDDEDWAAVGAAALRAASYSQCGTAGRFSSSHGYLHSPQTAFSYGAASAAGKQPPFSFDARMTASGPSPALAATGFASIRSASDEQEREAIEGLLRLGSV